MFEQPRPSSLPSLFSRRLKNRRPAGRRRREKSGHASFERLDGRRMLAFDLVAAYAQGDAPFFVTGGTSATLTEAPQQITLRFSPGVKIDPATLGGISVQRVGDANPLAPGSILVNDLPNQNEVVIRFADTLVDGSYRITVSGGAGGLKTKLGDTVPGDTMAATRTLDVRVDLGAFVVSVVPQPVVRVGGALTQNRDVIDVYFNAADPLNEASAKSTSSYRLFEINPQTGAELTNTQGTPIFVNPTGITYDRGTGKATLTFASGVIAADKLYRLQIGVSEALVKPADSVAEGSDDNSSFTTAYNLGTLTGGGATVFGEIQSSKGVTTPVPGPVPGAPIAFPNQPGSLDEPGHRDLPDEIGNDHGLADHGVSANNEIGEIYYNFRLDYGVDPFGNALSNLITETQKQRAREIFELYSRYTGVRFVETAVDGITVVTGDMRALDPTISTAPAGLAAEGLMAIMDSTENWGASEYGGSWFRVAMHEIGHALGLVHSYDVNSIMGAGLTGEPVFPGDYDTIHLAQRFPANGSDVDVYKFTLPTAGRVSAETVVGRLGQVATSKLDSLLTLYREDLVNGRAVRTLVARNDDYYGRDSFIGLDLAAGTYYLGVSSTGNDAFNPEISESGYGGRSDGAYQLRLGFEPVSISSTTIVDASGTLLDGDRDGKPGGAFNFWFNTAAQTDVQATNKTIFVDKASTAVGIENGTLANPFKRIDLALAAASPGAIVRILGNTANAPYLIGTKLGGGPLEDGATFNVPAGVTVMIDEGAIFKLREAIIDVGSSSALVSRAGAALQVLGTPANNVQFTSYHDDDIGGDSDGVGTSKGGGQWGGIVLRADSDFAATSGGAKTAFVNSISQATVKYGGGQVFVDSQRDYFAPIQLENTRPTIAFNKISANAGAAISATPNSFEDSNGRIGPEIRGNALSSNSINGLFVKIRTPLGGEPERLDVSARFRSTDIVYVLQDNLFIAGGAGGYESRSDRTGSLAAGSNKITNLPKTSDLIVGVVVEGEGIPPDTKITSIDAANGTVTLSSPATRTATRVDLFFTFARKSGRLAIDPGVVVKVQGARIELERGTSQLIAEGTSGQRVVFTSLGDNRFGAGGTFDTNGNLPDVRTAGDWGGIVLNAGSKASIDHAYIAYGGGLTPIEGAIDRFNVIEAHQGDLRLAHSRIENNASGLASSERNDRGTNAAATVFVRGAQPVILGNDFRDNLGAVVSVDVNSLNDSRRPDPGRSTGPVDRDARYDDNRGVLVRDNRLSYSIDAASGRPAGGATMGMRVRGGEITVEGVWDDTDIVHVLQSEIWVQNFHTATGLRLMSQPESSLVVKLAGTDAGFTASGYGLDITDRIGGTVQVVGQPGYPVILTSLKDDSVGASLDPLGQLTKDTNTDGSASVPAAGDWRSLKFLPMSNDRNVAIVQETERAAAGWTEVNAIPQTAQALGVLAPNFRTGTNTTESAQEKSGDDNRRLGFEVHGAISWNSPGDVDVYRFSGYAGSEVWIDIDKTSPSLDAMIELLDAAGNVLARSVDVNDGSLTDGTVAGALPLTKDDWRGGDFYTVNPRDAGMRVILPGPVGSTIPNQYFIRVRSQPRYEPFTTTATNGGVTATDKATYEADLADPTKVTAGATSGAYELRVRLQQRDEKPGSTVRYADIRYPQVGIDVQGLPRNSLLTGETGESAAANELLANAQEVGNLLQADHNTISIAGRISSATDVDWYTFTLNLEQIQSIGGVNSGLKSWSTVFDLDYGDGLQGDFSLFVFDSGGRLIFMGHDSDVASDQPGIGQGTDFDDVSRGSVGKLDPFIGSVQMPAGTPTGTGAVTSSGSVDVNFGSQMRYYVAVASNRNLPAALDATFRSTATNSLIRLEPISSLKRIVEDHIGFDGYNSNADQPPNLRSSTTGQIIDVSGAIALSAHVTPFTLSDVTLFVSTATGLYTVDAMRGGEPETTVSASNGASDLVMRSDGRLYGYRGVPGNTTTAGTLDLIDTGTGARENVGNDSIPNAPAVTPVPASQTNVATTSTGAAVSATVFPLANRNITAGSVSGVIRLQYTDNSSGTPVNYNGSWNFSFNATGGFVLGLADPSNTPGVPTPRALGSSFNRTTSLATIAWTANVPPAAATIQTVSYTYDPDPHAVTTNEVDAIAWRRTGVGQYATLHYSVRDGSRSRLYRANPANGSAAVVEGQPWGRVGAAANAYIQDGDNSLGIVTGMAYSGETLYGVDDKGNFFSINPTNAVATVIETFAGTNFQGLAIGPQNLQDGFFKDTLFAIDETGVLYCLDTSGNMLTVFDSDNDAVADASFIATTVSDPTGLAFSPLDINLWHPTTRKATEAGHGINAAPDQTRDNTWRRSVSRREYTESQGGVSMYFGFEQYAGTTPYLTYDADRGQYGVLDNAWQQDLSSNDTIRNNYNLPGGAYGSLTTKSFSLEGYAYTDKPTLYFNYWLQTQGAASNADGMRDSARVFVSTDDGPWQVIATNNSTRSTIDQADAELPAFASASSRASSNGNQHVQELFDSASWRQARIDLGRYAGQSNIRLRFDFSTAGEFDGSQVKGSIERTVTTDVTDGPDVVVNDVTGILPGMTVVATGVVGRKVVSIDVSTKTVTLTGNVTLSSGDAIVFAAIETAVTTDVTDKPEVVVDDVTGILPGMTVVAAGVVDRSVASIDVSTKTVTLTGNVTLTSGATIRFATKLNDISGLAGATGDFGSPQRGQNNQFEGFYVDDIIVGFAERGEMVTGAMASQTSFFDLASVGTPTRGTETVGAQSLAGTYQLEIRRGTTYGEVFDPMLSSVAIKHEFDTNDDLVASNPAGANSGSPFAAPWIGDANTPRQQGQFLIENNVISSAATYGISIEAGVRDSNTKAPTAGVPRNLPVANVNRLVPGVVVVNNVVSTSGTAGILFSGDPNTGSVPTAAVPYGRIVNNTIYGGATPAGVGVEVTENAGPTIMNNLFANLATGVSVDATSGVVDSLGNRRTVITTSAFRAVGTQVSGGVQTFAVDLTTEPFVNAAAGNFYLRAGSAAIDSALDFLADRSDSVVVTSPIGMPQSPIIAPDRDIYGQLRGDDGLPTSYPGLGNNVYKDRGAIDRVDVDKPVAVLAVPLDGSSDDLNAAAHAVRLERDPARSVTRFEIQLNDTGVGIDKTTVVSGAFQVRRNGVLLVAGTDYSFNYLDTTNRVVFESPSVFLMGTYDISVVRTTGTAPVNVINDLAGNPLSPNRTDGTTVFTIELADVPTAPAGLVAVSGDASVQLSWTASTTDVSQLTSYEIQWATNASFSSPTTIASLPNNLVTRTVSPLVNGTQHWFRVRAVNAIGASDWSNVAGPVVPLAIPTFALAADTGASASDWVTTNAQVNVSGIMPGATWEYSTDGGVVWTPGGAGTSFALGVNVTYPIGAVRVRQTAVGGTSGVSQNAVPITIDTIVAAPTLALAFDTGTSNTDGVTSNGLVNVSGIEAGATWQYRINGGVWTTGTGSTFTLSPGTYAIGSIRVRQTDLAGNQSSEGANAGVITVDTSAAAPTVAVAADNGTSNSDGVTNNGLVNVSGIEVGATWQYRINGGVWTTGTGSTFTLSPGTYAIGSIRVRQIDLAGSQSPEGSNAVAITIDVTAPATPTFALAVDTGSNTSDGVTSNGLVNVTGVEANATWQFSTNGGVDWTTGTGSTFMLSPGTYAIGSIRVRQIDLAGNQSAERTNPSGITVDTSVAAPTFALAADTGTSNSDGVTNNGLVNVSGIEAGATWQYRINGGGWVTGSGTTFTLPEGVYAIGAIGVRQTDRAGNASGERSNTGAITVDVTAPGVPVISGNLPSGSLTNLTTPTLTGRADPRVSVTVSAGATVLGTVVSGDAGNWRLVSPALANGRYQIVAASSDPAGNTSRSAAYVITIDTVNAITAAPTRLTGRAGNGVVDLVWTAPAVPAGTVITDYVVQYSTDGGVRWITAPDVVSAATRSTVGVPVNGIPYTFRVAAQTATGIGIPSAASAVLVPFSPTAVPTAPPSLAATKVANGSVQLNWTAPPANAGGPVNGYVVQYRLATSTTWTTVTLNSSTTLAWTVSRLTAGRTYAFRVAARNLAGVGTFSSERQAIA